MSIFAAFREREDLRIVMAVSGTEYVPHIIVGGVFHDLPNQMPKYEESQIRETSELDSLNINRKGHY